MRDSWSSKFSFILVAAGSAIGLGNIWRFPIMVGQNGGAVFVLFYILFVLFFALPILNAEISLGRAGQMSVVGIFKKFAPKGIWKYLGFLYITTSIFILSYYSVVAGWVFNYFYFSISGKLNDLSNIEKAKDVFQSMSISPFYQIFGLFIIIFLTSLIVIGGIKGGIEKVCKILMPLLFILLIILVLRSITLEGAYKGIKFYLFPDISKISPKVLISGMGQAFFSLSLGVGAMLTYGSYLSKNENIFKSSIWIVVADTSVAFFAGLIIFPSLFSLENVNVAAGPSLIFIVLPIVFYHLPFGIFFETLFFILIIIAAITSTISLLEIPVTYLIDEKKYSRKKATILIGLLTFLLGIPSALSLGISKTFTSFLKIFGGEKGFLEVLDIFFGHFSLSIGSLLLCLFIAYKLKFKEVIENLNNPQKFKFEKLFKVFISLICPLGIFILILFFILNPKELG